MKLYASILFNSRAMHHRIYRKFCRYFESLFAKINEAPIFVLGNQKSGTTAVALLLADATGKSVTIDLIKEIRNPEFQYLSRRSCSFQLFLKKNRADFSRAIIKEPNLTIFYEQLKAYFPAARFIIVVRDPRYNIRSILDRLNLSGDHIGSVDDLPNCIPLAWRYVLNNRWYMQGSSNCIISLSERWNFMADVYLKNKLDIILIRYEDFCRDKRQVIERLANEIRFPVRFDIDNIVDRQFQGRGKNRKTDAAAFFSEYNLNLIETTCYDRMKELGY